MVECIVRYCALLFGDKDDFKFHPGILCESLRKKKKPEQKIGLLTCAFFFIIFFIELICEVKCICE
jgi:hypothetical protein